MNGAKIDLLFGMPAVEYVFRKAEDGSMILDEEGNTVGNSSIVFLIYAGYHNSCIANGLTPKIPISNFFDWVEEMVEAEEGKKELAIVAETYRDSKSTKKFQDRADKQVEEIKKKMEEMSGRISNPSVTENSDSPGNSTAD
jgi:hypothetical protein